MQFPHTLAIDLSRAGIQGLTPRPLTIYGGITTFLGPNGSGKTQLMRALKFVIEEHVAHKKTRYVSAGRLGPLENFRSNFDGQHSHLPNYDNAILGDMNHVNRRHSIETVLGDFASLSARPDIFLKVQERLKKLFNRDLRLEWHRGRLRLFLRRVDQRAAEYSSAREASGILHLVAALTALYDDEVGCILIDEPEVSLHPQLQSFMYQEMKRVAGDPDDKGKKLIFLSTHSTEFVNVRSIDELASIVFCNDIYEEPVQIDPSIDEFKDRKIRLLLSRMGQEHKLALFCQKPFLVEGISDQLLCMGLSRTLDLSMEAAGSQILPVSGKGQLPTVCKLFRLVGKNPVALVDADGIADGLDIINLFTSLPLAKSIAVEKGHRDAFTFARNVYNDFSQLVSEHWGDIHDLASTHVYWKSRANEEEAKAKRRAAFCSILNAEEEEIRKLNNPDKWLEIRARLVSLLEFLEALGCFVLRKGTIENYYTQLNHIRSDEKPHSALQETIHIDTLSQNAIEQNYRDIISALLHASSVQEVDESGAVRSLALAIVTPALASISENSSSEEINAQSKNLLGDRAELFHFKVNEENGLEIVVELSSSILSVEGFPLRIRKGDNLISVITEQMKLD